MSKICKTSVFRKYTFYRGALLGDDSMRFNSVAVVSEEQVFWEGKKELFSVKDLTIVREIAR